MRHSHLARSVSVLTATALALVGCGGDHATGARLTVADSAGVTILTSAAPAWPDDGGWHLPGEPLVVIPPEGTGYQLVSVYSALRLDNGTVVVANMGDNQLLFFGPDGRLLTTAGRQGSGPGEFRNLAFVWRGRGDSLVAFDWLGARVSVWNGPEFGRVAALRSPDGGQVIAWGALPDGGLLVSRTATYRPDAAIGLHRDSVPLMRYGPDAEPGDTLARLPYREVYRLEWEGSRTSTDPPFGRDFAVAPLNDGFVHGAAEGNEVEIRGSDGRLRRILRFPGPPRPVTEGDIALHRRHRIERDAGYGATTQETERLLAKLTYPAVMPSHGRILVDRTDHIWVEEYEPDLAAPRAWRVLSPDSGYLGDVRVPPGFHVLDVGANYVLGRSMDELGREALTMYALESR